MAGKSKITIATLVNLGAPKLAALLLAGAAGNKQLKQAIELAMTQERHFATALQKVKGGTSAVLAAAERSLSAMRPQLYPTCGQAG
jgi:hypothetical protein